MNRPSVSLAVTAFNEMSDGRLNGERISDCIFPAQIHPAIDEIVIVDDASEDFPELYRLVTGYSKVKVFQNKTNRGVFGNKLEAISRATSEWVITCDSDNVMDAAYLDKVLATIGDPSTWSCASFAKPKFDYRSMIGSYDLAELAAISGNRVFRCFFNTGNQTVNREAFMQVFGKYRDKRADLMLPNYLGLPYTDRETHYWRLVFDALDSFIFNMQWVLAGNRLHIVEGLEYEHYYATGDEGNYVRSPGEKDRLGQVLFELLESEIRQANLTGAKQ